MERGTYNVALDSGSPRLAGLARGTGYAWPSVHTIVAT